MAKFPRSLTDRGHSWLRKKAKRGFSGYPVGTVAFYGPTADFASKLVVGIFAAEGKDVNPMRKWFSDESDLRRDEAVALEVSAFLKENNVKSVSMVDRIIGCPHEEGIDYPEGKPCPQCPFWAHRNRFTHELIQ